MHELSSPLLASREWATHRGAQGDGCISGEVRRPNTPRGFSRRTEGRRSVRMGRDNKDLLCACRFTPSNERRHGRVRDIRLRVIATDVALVENPVRAAYLNIVIDSSR